MNSARYAELFEVEARERLDEIDDALLALEQAPAPDRSEAVATLFRAVHTIKGMAASMGYERVERLAHALESLLGGIRVSAASCTPEMIDLLFDGGQLLADEISFVAAGTGPHILDAVTDRTEPRPLAGTTPQRDHALRDMLRRLDTATRAAGPEQAHSPGGDVDLFGTARYVPGEAAGGSQHARRVTVTLVDDCPLKGVRAMLLVAKARTVTLVDDCPLKGVRAMLLVAKARAVGTVSDLAPAESVWTQGEFDGVLRFTLESRSDEPLDAALIESAIRSAGDVATVVVGESPSPPVERAPSGDEHERFQRAGTVASSTESSGGQASRQVRIDQRRLDTLLELVGELVVNRDRLVRAADDPAHAGVDRTLPRIVAETARLVGALHEEVMQSRLVPIGRTLDRFPRQVRDIARELGKDVGFEVEGSALEVDGSLVDAIAEPVLHLVRNALDHGIETPAERRAAGKSPTARLTIRAVRERSSVIVQVEDDGRGIDRAAVRSRAVAGGLLPDTVDVSELDDDRLLALLAHPGLSTASRVTNISGRGVGVDIVATRVRALGGVLSVETIDTVGTLFTMRLPSTLSIARVVLVRVGGETYALPAAYVSEVVACDRVGDGDTMLRDGWTAIVDLRGRFGAPVQDAPNGHRDAAVVDVRGHRVAVLVDALLGHQDIVVKPLHVPRDAARWFSGATVLGDGTPALIVDVGSLLE